MTQQQPLIQIEYSSLSLFASSILPSAPQIDLPTAAIHKLHEWQCDGKLPLPSSGVWWRQLGVDPFAVCLPLLL